MAAPAGRGGTLHELSIAQEIYRASRAAVAGHGPGRLETVMVAVGELSAVEPDLLVFAWQALTQGGPDAASALKVEWRPARQFCAGCNADQPRSPGSWLRLCPQCGMPLAVSGGDELDVLQVTFLPDEAAGEGGASHG
jgi:hydrogenase nickel incorporation protein HypA/HybF